MLHCLNTAKTWLELLDWTIVAGDILRKGDQNESGEMKLSWELIFKISVRIKDSGNN